MFSAGRGRELEFRIRKGLDLPMAGAAGTNAQDAQPVSRVALVGSDYPGLSARLQTSEGERVRLGQTLFTDRHDPAIRFAAPGAGIVEAINRGARRALVSLVIRLDGADAVSFADHVKDGLASLTRSDLIALLTESGLWTAFRARPFGRIPAPNSRPAAIFVTAIDTNPLAPDPLIAIRQHEAAFGEGVSALERLTDGPVFVCAGPAETSPLPVSENDRTAVARFWGPHPAGLPGTHIHLLMPAGPRRTVWHIGYQDTIAVGKLLREGRIWTDRVVALCGPALENPTLLRTRQGADVAEIAQGRLAAGGCRILSGSVLDGRNAGAPVNFLGRFHNQITALPEADGDDAWRGLHSDFGVGRLFRRPRNLTTALHGAPGPMLPGEVFDRLMPLDIVAAPLLRALLSGDGEMAQALGCLELSEEDLALCSYVCPGKSDYGAALREILSRIERDG